MYSIEDIEIRKKKILEAKLELKAAYYFQEKALAMGGLLMPVHDLEIQQLLYDDPEIKEHEDNFNKNFTCHIKI
jgi:hypothetical protein